MLLWQWSSQHQLRPLVQDRLQFKVGRLEAVVRSHSFDACWVSRRSYVSVLLSFTILAFSRFAYVAMLSPYLLALFSFQFSHMLSVLFNIHGFPLPSFIEFELWFFGSWKQLKPPEIGHKKSSERCFISIKVVSLRTVKCNSHFALSNSFYNRKRWSATTLNKVFRFTSDLIYLCVNHYCSRTSFCRIEWRAVEVPMIP